MHTLTPSHLHTFVILQEREALFEEAMAEGGEKVVSIR